MRAQPDMCQTGRNAVPAALKRGVRVYSASTD